MEGSNVSREKVYTTGFGAPVDDDQNSKTAGSPGPVPMQDAHLLRKLGHFNRERIPERVVHAKGAGAHGYFEVTGDVIGYNAELIRESPKGFSTNSTLHASGSPSWTSRRASAGQ